MTLGPSLMLNVLVKGYPRVGSLADMVAKDPQSVLKIEKSFQVAWGTDAEKYNLCLTRVVDNISGQFGGLRVRWG